MRNSLRVLLGCVLVCSFPAFGVEVQVVHAGWLLAVPGEAPKAEQTVVIKDGRISQVLPGFVAAKELSEKAQLVDLSEQFVLPGLIDLHVHLLLELGPNAQLQAITDSIALQAFKGAANAAKTLRAGFTTVRDLGGQPASIYALRDAIAKGYLDGPRVLAAGSPLAATGGHGDVDGIRADLMAAWTPETICDGPISCRKAVRHAVKYGADWIKVTATGGVLSDTRTGLGVQMTAGELLEIVQTAHNLGLKVAAHAHGNAGINAALAAGVDTIEHGSFIDRASLKLFKSSGAYLVPTLMPGHFVPLTMHSNPFFSPAIIAKAEQASASAKQSFARAYSNGVPIAFGTDTGVTPHGQNAKEFALMVAQGMSAAEAIESATVTAAKVVGLESQIGTLEPGKWADLIATAKNPLENITELERVHTVMKAGKLIKTR